MGFGVFCVPSSVPSFAYSLANAVAASVHAGNVVGAMVLVFHWSSHQATHVCSYGIASTQHVDFIILQCRSLSLGYTYMVTRIVETCQAA